MAYPYPTRNRACGDTIEVHVLGTSSGTPVTYTAALTTTGVSKSINLPPNSWQCAATLWSTGNDRALSVKVRPWVDPGQTIIGAAMRLVPVNSVTAATVVTLAATGASGTRGAAFHIVSPTGSVIAPNGLRVTVTAATALTRGTYDCKLVAVPEA